MDAVTCDIGGRRVLGPLDLVALAGPNGSGKTTLLQFAAGHRAPSSGSVRCGSGAIAMLDQHVAFLRADETLLEAMRRMNPGLTLNACPAALARFAFRNITAAKHCGSLSGGERMRAGLACILSAPEPPALLMLDEPTNHLDICSIEVLEAGLRDYRGALLVVSHDAVFLDEIGAQRSVFSGVIDPISAVSRLARLFLYLFCSFAEMCLHGFTASAFAPFFCVFLAVILVAGARSNLHLRPEQVKMVAGTGVDHNLRSTPVKMVAGGRTHHNLLFRAAA